MHASIVLPSSCSPTYMTPFTTNLHHTPPLPPSHPLSSLLRCRPHWVTPVTMPSSITFTHISPLPFVHVSVLLHHHTRSPLFFEPPSCTRDRPSPYQPVAMPLHAYIKMTSALSSFSSSSTVPPCSHHATLYPTATKPSLSRGHASFATNTFNPHATMRTPPTCPPSAVAPVAILLPTRPLPPSPSRSPQPCTYQAVFRAPPRMKPSSVPLLTCTHGGRPLLPSLVQYLISLPLLLTPARCMIT